MQELITLILLLALTAMFLIMPFLPQKPPKAFVIAGNVLCVAFWISVIVVCVGVLIRWLSYF